MIEKNIRRRRESAMIYYTADLHVHYAQLLPSRPFATVEEMDEALVKNWNDTVGPEDTVLCWWETSAGRRAGAGRAAGAAVGP